MEVKVGNRVYNMIFGLDALGYLDETYSVLEETGVININMAMGQGINMLIVGLEAGNYTAIGNFIKAGTSTESSKPSNSHIENFIVELEEENNLNSFCKEALDFLGINPLTRKKVKDIKGNIETAKHQEEKKSTKTSTK